MLTLAYSQTLLQSTTSSQKVAAAAMQIAEKKV
jgi:hypothetical protein